MATKPEKYQMKPIKSGSPRKNVSNNNESRSTKLNINFSLNAKEEALFDAITEILEITKGAKKEVFISALKDVYERYSGKDPVRVFKLDM